SIPAALKLCRTDPATPESTGATTEKWILRKSCADLLPRDLVWRKKAQFDEGSGTVAALQEALQLITGQTGSIDRDREAAIYEDILRSRYADADLIFANAGRWVSNRVAV
ncbi:MAG: asparagine synthase-related protein, partial [Phyllobacterium sp.]